MRKGNCNSIYLRTEAFNLLAILASTGFVLGTAGEHCGPRSGPQMQDQARRFGYQTSSAA